VIGILCVIEPNPSVFFSLNSLRLSVNGQVSGNMFSFLCGLLKAVMSLKREVLG
jgi:hypothetical protein